MPRYVAGSPSATTRPDRGPLSLPLQVLFPSLEIAATLHAGKDTFDNAQQTEDKPNASSTSHKLAVRLVARQVLSKPSQYGIRP